MNKTIENHCQQITKEISDVWDQNIVPELIEYIKIPNKSVMFDANWKTNGHMDQAMDLIKKWCAKQPIKGMKLSIEQLPNRTPLLFIEIPGQIEETVLLYGHMDKQPEMDGWDTDLGPWKPVLKGEKLYGRGGADDGYSAYAALTAIATLQRYNVPHARCIVIIEASEESGSVDLPFYLKELKQRIRSPNLIVCLDSGCGNYEQLWCTTSLRGICGGKLSVEVSKYGVHSGIGSGTIPNPVMILRQLLDRIEDSNTGNIQIKELYTDIPTQTVKHAEATAKALGENYLKAYEFLEGVQSLNKSVTEMLLNRTWRPTLSVTGFDGLPATASAGNVTVPRVSAVLSVRLPPTTDPEAANNILKQVLEQNPPFGAKVTFRPETPGGGWTAPPVADWLADANNKASQLFFNKPAAYIGEGGSIPFMGMLGEMYPNAQFLITGVLGPLSNAHGPNEFLHIPMGKGVTACVASVLADHYEQFK